MLLTANKTQHFHRIFKISKYVYEGYNVPGGNGVTGTYMILIDISSHQRENMYLLLENQRMFEWKEALRQSSPTSEKINT